MSELAALQKRVRENPEDAASWLVLADKLTEEGNPLGEFLVLSLEYEKAPAPEAKKRRMRKLARAWQARFAPTGTFVSWFRSRITLRYKAAADVLTDAAQLRQIGLKLELEVMAGKYSAVDQCCFDAGFTRLACMQSSLTVTNQNHSPGMDEDSEHYRDVTVWRVSDGAVLFKRIFGARWSWLEFRDDGLYGIESGRAELLTQFK